MAKRLTWRKQPSETGLARVCQDERGYDLRYDGREVGYVRPEYVGWARNKVGYYWTAPADDELGILHRNTCNTPVEDIDTAKADCLAYVRECMAKKESPEEGE